MVAQQEKPLKPGAVKSKVWDVLLESLPTIITITLGIIIAMISAIITIIAIILIFIITTTLIGITIMIILWRL